MGGQGKTQSALRYCRKAFQNRTFNTVLWIDASSEISAHQAIESILSKAEIPTSALEFERNLLAFKDALTSLKGPCLLVFDNYDTPRNFTKIADMFVHHEQICIMLTSRHHGSLRLGTPVHVREMDQSDAEDLLLTSSGLVTDAVNPKHLAKIVNMLGRLPLALDQAGAYIRKLHLSLDVFEKHYINKQKKILQYTPDLFEYRKSLLPGSDPSVLSVFTTWELSLEQLGDDRRHLEHLLTLSAFFDHNKVHEALFSTRCTLEFTPCSGVEDEWLQCFLTDAAWDSDAFQDIIANLYGLSLLQKFWTEDGHIAFSLHPLVNDWLRTRIGEKDRASMIVEAAVTAASTEDSLIIFAPLLKCVQDLSDYSKILYNCVAMRPPRAIENGAPVLKFVADELISEPRYGRPEASYCPHGRLYQTIPSTIRLKKIIMSRYLASDIYAAVQAKLARLSSLFPPGVDRSLTWDIDISSIAYIGELLLLNELFGVLAYQVDQLFQISREALEKFKTMLSEDNTLSLSTDILSQEIATLCQQVEKLSIFNKGFKEAEAKVKQGGKMVAAISSHANLEPSSQTDLCLRSIISERLAAFKCILEQFSTLTQPSEFALVRDQLRSLPFLQSGS